MRAELREPQMCDQRSGNGCLCDQSAVVRVDGRAVCSLHALELEQKTRKKARR